MTVDTPLTDCCRQLWPLHRTLVSDGMDTALNLVGKMLPSGVWYEVERYAAGKEVWTWRVPERWVVHSATLTLGDDLTPVASFAAHPLHLVSYSLPYEATLTWAALRPHLVIGPKAFPDALPWAFKYYERDWGFCLTYHQHQAILDRAGTLIEGLPCHVRIRTEFRATALADGLGVGVGVVPPTFGRVPGHAREILVCADLCHPYQVNDSITGAVAAIEIARRLVADPLPAGSRNVRFLFVPEVIGSICYLAHHPDVIALTDGAVFSEMLGTPGPLVLQTSRGGFADRLTRMASATPPFMEEDLIEGRVVVPFRDPSTALNDEIVLNGPGVNIPTIAVSRYPYPEYHTSADTPDILREDKLEEAIDYLERVVRIAAMDWTPKRTFTGPIFLSRYGLWKDWRTHRKENAAMERIMLLLEGEHSVFDIAQVTDLSFEEAYNILEELRSHRLVTEVA